VRIHSRNIQLWDKSEIMDWDDKSRIPGHCGFPLANLHFGQRLISCLKLKFWMTGNFLDEEILQSLTIHIVIFRTIKFE